MGEDKDLRIEDKLIAQSLLISALPGSKRLDTFSMWLLTAFGAVFALIISNWIELSRLVDVKHFATAAGWLVTSLILAVVQKYVSLTVMIGYESAKESEERLGELARKNLTIKDDKSLEYILNELIRACWYPVRWIASSVYNKVLSGDITHGIRILYMMLQFQAWVVLGQVVCHVVTICQLINSIVLK